MVLQEGDWINIQGTIGENEVIIPNAINSIPIDSKVSEKENDIPLDIHVQIIAIKENLKLPNRTSDSNFAVLESGTKDKVSYIISEIPHTEIKQVEFRKKIKINNKEKNLFVLASLQPINETISVLTSFYPFIFLFSLIASLIIAIIHSSWVSRPIVVINKAANKMANLEFDITLDESRSDELGQLSKSLNSMSKSLENSINELTQAKDVLQKDYDLEVRRQRAQKEFVANASHELKTPLSVIKGYAEGIKDGMGHDQLDEYVGAIVEESKKMDELILSMLQLSKLDLLGNKLNLEDIDLEIIIFDLIQSFELMLSEHKLLIDVSGGFGDIHCDKEMIKSAIQNLLSNAIKYTGKNSTIKIRHIVKENVHRFEIENESKSFTQDEKERIWGKFYKRDLSHNREVSGTGLGLAIVKGIFEAHQFEYGVYNTDTGICFWFEY